MKCTKNGILGLHYSTAFPPAQMAVLNGQLWLMLSQWQTCYLLTSLRDHSINYIGTTTQKMSDRLAYHNTGTSHLEGKYPQKGPWICTAIATGFGNDVQVMQKFQSAWTKEKEQAVTSLRHRVHFDMITCIGRILKGCPEFCGTPIKLTQHFKFAHNQI